MKRKVDRLSFFDHLDELRERLIKAVTAFVLASCLAYQYKDHILAFIIKPVGKLMFTSPADAFVIQLGLSFLGGFLLSLPVTVYQLWRFVAAGLKEEERRFVSVFAPVSFVLFVLGVAFAYYVFVPFSLSFLLSFSSDTLVAMITVKDYFSYVVTLIFAFGVIFEFPLVILFLAKIGIATPAFLIQKRRHSIVLIFITAAILTPPDGITQLLMAVPLLALYELSIIVAKFVYRPPVAYES
ncbi:MAG TPA: twin-arginine translocase subunit TatC [Candidatus Omnitrophota bacterium]|nr:twin-arginine translocase subunit TatC [Candidatus Omnitrophota bacterium]